MEESDVELESAYSFRSIRSFIKLYNYHEAPGHQQHNPYITSGYRCFLSAKQCLQSVFFPSNELFNIWSHMVMVFFWLALFVYDEIITIPSMPGRSSDYFLYAIYTFCVVACMSLSTGYHIFNSHSTEQVCLKWYALDLAGIAVGTIGCYMMGLYYGYYCFSQLQMSYVSILSVMILITVYLMTRPYYLQNEWSSKRIIHLSFLAVFGVIPAIHWVFVAPSNDIKLFFPKIITLYLILGSAFFFYITKVPEYFLPGKFNLIGHSHNIWHILIASSFVYWRYAGLQLMEYRINTSCAANL